MAKPWEKFKKAEDAQPTEGPWSKFSAASAPHADEGILDRVKGLFTSEGRSNIREQAEPAINAAFDRENRRGRALDEQFADAALMGYLPQVQAGVGAMVGDDYTQSRDANIARLAQQKKDFPVTAAAGQVAGIGANMYATPVPKLAVLGKGLLGAAARGGLIGGAYSAAANPGDKEGVVDPLQLKERGEKGLEGAITGAKWGAGIHGALSLAKNAPAIGKTAMTTFLGPSRENIDYYLQNSKAVNSAKSIEELKGGVDKIVGGLRADVERGKMTLQEAKAQLAKVEEQIATTKRESGFSFQVTKTEINQTLRDAKRALESATREQVQKLKDVKAPVSLADDTEQAVRDLKKQVTDESGKSYEILDKAKGSVSVEQPYLELLKAREGLKVQGQQPVTPAGRAAYKEISDLADSLYKLPKNISMPEAKQIIQQIDQTKNMLYQSGQWTSDVDLAFKNVRRALDAQLKAQSPEYAKQMERVAELTRLHGDTQTFGERGSALSALNRIGSVTSAPEREALSKLGKATGRNYDEPVEGYLRAQGKLKDPRELERMQQSLPEYQRASEAEKAARMLEGPEAQREFIDRQIKEAGLLDRQSSAKGLVGKSESGLLNAEAKLDPFSNISEGTSEGKIKGLLRARPGEQIEIRKQFEELSKLSDTDFVKAIDDLRVNRAFQAGNRNGSRNVNMFSIVTGALGKAAGGAVGGAAIAGPAGAGVGAVLGGVSDHFGPAIAKKILDGVIKMGDKPSVIAIRNLNLPPNAENYLLRELLQYKFERATLPRVSGQPDEETISGETP